MIILDNKIKKRLSIVITNSLSSIALPAVNALFSLLVVRISGADTWGNFVFYFLWASLASFLMNWGNKDYLLREFSREPANISALWRESFFTRSLLILPCFAAFIFLFTSSESLLFLEWTILLFISQSFDALTAFHRKFLKSFLVEITAGVFLITVIIFKTPVDLFTVYLIYLCIRAVLFCVLFSRDIFERFNVKLKFSLIKKSIPFFLLGMTGLIGSRIDQYCVSLMLSKEELGKYNILKSFLLYFQAVSGFIVVPFVKDIYRMKEESLRNAGNKLFLAGLILTPLYISVLYVIMNYFYGFSFSVDVYIYGALFIPTVYFYSVKVFKMIKDNKIIMVIWITISAIILSAALNILLIPPLKIEGSLIASAAAGITSAVLYYLFNRREKTA